MATASSAQRRALRQVTEVSPFLVARWRHAGIPLEPRSVPGLPRIR
jgi:hypothetical protein